MNILFKTPRLVLRAFELDDAEKMFDLNADAEVLKYTGDTAFLSVEHARAFLDNYNDYQKNGYGRWAVLIKDTNEFIGWCGLKLNEENLTDIGFRFFRKEWNKGYATEAAKACLDYGFSHLKLNKIIGRASLENKASLKVLEKLNMKFWKYATFEGVKDGVYYSMSKEE